MRIWTTIVLSVLLAVPAFSQETPTETPTILPTATATATGPTATQTQTPTITPTPRVLPGRCTMSGLGITSIDGAAVGNLNDGFDTTPDLVLADADSNAVALVRINAIALQRVDCERAWSVSMITESQPFAVDVFLADAGLDLDVAVAGNSRGAVYLGDGLGGSAGGAGEQFDVPQGRAIAAANVDGDDADEILIGTLGGNNVQVLRLGQENSLFQPLPVGAPVLSLAVALLTDDQHPDVMVLNNQDQLLFFPRAVSTASPTNTPAGITPVSTPTPTPLPAVFEASSTLIDRVLDDDGDAGTPDVSFTITGFTVAGDELSEVIDSSILGFDNDGIPDLAVVGFLGGDPVGGALVTFRGTAAGGFGLSAPSVLKLGPNVSPSAVAVGDFLPFDPDTGSTVAWPELDIAVTDDGNDRVIVFRGLGDGTFEEFDTMRTGGGPTVMLVEDFDKDLFEDLAVGNRDDGSVSMFLTNVNEIATFTPTITNTPTLTPSITLTPSMTPTETPTASATFTETERATRTQTPTITTTPGLFELRGEACAVDGSGNNAGGVWILLGAAVIAGLRGRQLL